MINYDYPISYDDSVKNNNEEYVNYIMKALDDMIEASHDMSIEKHDANMREYNKIKKTRYDPPRELIKNTLLHMFNSR